ncbi:hypothetical protein BSIN_0178 [Burkholderia singularis]|uniref:Uncharacterized protein n=1 Tax=Burkholderia singularis TaxID=1503053 RepID=A0A238H2E6_9BURK|nr:hypothetical protein BSIN_0178 [Burkholderia singularis]
MGDWRIVRKPEMRRGPGWASGPRAMKRVVVRHIRIGGKPNA